jgi:2-polyprenyl-6-methoxyphenol hydroxylase-like FAD-dependent oxidoreductase
MGQGACQALEDAWVLADTLRRTQPDAQALLTYQRKRLAHANMVATRSQQIGNVAQWEHPLACWFRDHLLMLTPPRLLIEQMKPVMAHTLNAK